MLGTTWSRLRTESILKTEHRTPINEHWTLNTEYWIPNDECWMMNDECWVMSVECWIPNDEFVSIFKLLNFQILKVCFSLYSVFKDKKASKNLFLKEDFASQRSLMVWKFKASIRHFSPLISCLFQIYGDLNLPLG